METNKTVCREGYISREGQKLFVQEVMSVLRVLGGLLLEEIVSRGYSSTCWRMLHNSEGQNIF